MIKNEFHFLIKNEWLNRILDSVPNDDPQLKIRTLSLFIFLEDMMDTKTPMLGRLNDIKVLLEDE